MAGKANEPSVHVPQAPHEFPHFEEHEEVETGIVARFRRDPFFPLGIFGGLSLLGYSLFSHHRRNKSMPLSLYVQQLRVNVQGIAVGALAFGAFYHYGEDKWRQYKRDKAKKERQRLAEEEKAQNSQHAAHQKAHK